MNNLVCILLLINFIMFFKSGLATTDDTFPCSDDSWFYVTKYGTCYRPLMNLKYKYDWDYSFDFCNKTKRSNWVFRTSLITFANYEEAHYLAKEFLKKGYREPMMVGAQRIAGKFVWVESNTDVDFTGFKIKEDNIAFDCLQLSYTTVPVGDSENWELEVTLSTVACTKKLAVMCEHEVPRCNINIGGHSWSTMTIEPPSAAPLNILKSVCKPGLRRSEILSNIQVKSTDVDITLTRGFYRCTGQRFDEHYITEVLYSGYTVPECVAIQCRISLHRIQHIDIPSLTFYSVNEYNESIFNYNDRVTVKCSPGYVSFNDFNNTTATLTCNSAGTSGVGQWIPRNHQPCVPIRCDEEELMSMIPKNAKMTSARNPLTNQVYGQRQHNQFFQYGVVPTIRCLPGFLFPDRTSEKSVICSLAEYSSIKATYYGYSGTTLPLASECVEATCLHENIIIKPQYYMTPKFTVTKANLEISEQTTHSGEAYKQGTIIRFFCMYGYESVNQTNDINMTCGENGQWEPNFSPCIQKLEKILINRDGRFQKEPKESTTGVQLTSIMIIIVCIFVGLILVLDFFTINRDIKRIKSNLELQNRRIQLTRNKKITK